MTHQSALDQDHWERIWLDVHATARSLGPLLCGNQVDGEIAADVALDSTRAWVERALAERRVIVVSEREIRSYILRRLRWRLRDQARRFRRRRQRLASGLCARKSTWLLATPGLAQHLRQRRARMLLQLLNAIEAYRQECGGDDGSSLAGFVMARLDINRNTFDCATARLRRVASTLPGQTRAANGAPSAAMPLPRPRLVPRATTSPAITTTSAAARNDESNSRSVSKSA